MTNKHLFRPIAIMEVMFAILGIHTQHKQLQDYQNNKLHMVSSCIIYPKFISPQSKQIVGNVIKYYLVKYSIRVRRNK